MKSIVISSVLAISCLCVAPLNIRDAALIGTTSASLGLAIHRRRLLSNAYINSNFNCYTRVGAEVVGNELLRKERRRIASGQLAMITFDVAGMGEKNIEIGELAVNAAIKSVLDDIKSWRGVRFLSQINSGDEFAIVVDRVDVDGIAIRIDELLKLAGFKGAYVASLLIDPSHSYFDAAHKGMESVYKVKQIKGV